MGLGGATPGSRSLPPERMETQNQLERVTVTVRGDRTIEGDVRVRRIRAHVGRFRLAFHWFRPAAVIVRDPQNARRLTFPRRRMPLWILAVAPVAAHIVLRFLIRGGGRP